MSKYTALINEFDKDYRSYSGEVTISVSSWEEAEEWCKKESWSGYMYSVHLLEDKNTCQVYWTKEEMK